MAEHRTTLKDIATVVGVSPRAVSAALNGTGRVSPQLRDRIHQVAKELHYRPNVLARGLVQNRTYLLGAVFPYANVSFFNDIISGIEERCTQMEYDLLLGNANLLEYEDESPAIERMLNRGVDGILCAPDYREIAVFRKLEREGPPTVQVMTRIHESKLPFVGVDNRKGGRIACSHLIELGHRKIGFLSATRHHYAEVEDRYEGYLQTLIQNGIQLDTERYTEASDLSVEGGERAAEALIQRNPEMSAIFAPTDYAAVGALRAGLKAGKRIPEELSVIGYDDLSIAANQIAYPISTISQPKREVGYAVFDILSRMIQGERPGDILMEPKLIARTTTGSPGKEQ